METLKRAGETTYTATFTLDEDGWIVAQVVEVPGAASQGRDSPRAMKRRDLVRFKALGILNPSHPEVVIGPEAWSLGATAAAPQAKNRVSARGDRKPSVLFPRCASRPWCFA